MVHDTAHNRASASRRTGAFIFAAGIGLAMLAYGWSIFAASRGPGDWLLIVPAALVGAGALAWDGIAGRRAARAIPSGETGGRKAEIRPVLLIALILAFAAGLPFMGFDIGTAVFLALALWVLGERRLWLIVFNALAGTALLVWIFHDLLMVRLPLAIF